MDFLGIPGESAVNMDAKQEKQDEETLKNILYRGGALIDKLRGLYEYGFMNIHGKWTQTGRETAGRLLKKGEIEEKQLLYWR